MAAYARIEKLPVLREADWAMVLEADEFLNVHLGNGTISDLIEAAPQATAFLINWRIAGSGTIMMSDEPTSARSGPCRSTPRAAKRAATRRLRPLPTDRRT